MADRYMQIRRDMDERLAEAHQYRGSDAYAAFARLLDAIDRCYDEDLRTADEHRLPKVRGASAQCRALYETLIDRQGFASPKV